MICCPITIMGSIILSTKILINKSPIVWKRIIIVMAMIYALPVCSKSKINFSIPIRKLIFRRPMQLSLLNLNPPKCRANNVHIRIKITDHILSVPSIPGSRIRYALHQSSFNDPLVIILECLTLKYQAIIPYNF